MPLTTPPPVAPAPAEATPDGGPDERVERTDRWDDLGLHIAQILHRAHEQAAAIRLSARAEVDAATWAAEQDRIAARDARAEAELWAAAQRAQVEVDAEQLMADAHERARRHVVTVLGRAEPDLAALRRLIGATRDRLLAVHDLVAATLDRDIEEHEFAAPSKVLSNADRR